MRSIIKKHKYYILYKVKRDAFTNNIIDLIYLNEFKNYNSIKDYTNIHKSNIKKMINNSFDKNIKTFNDYTIILEDY